MRLSHLLDLNIHEIKSNFYFWKSNLISVKEMHEGFVLIKYWLFSMIESVMAVIDISKFVENKDTITFTPI